MLNNVVYALTETASTETAESLMTNLGTIFTHFMDMCGNVVSFIGSNPLCLVPIGIFVAGGAIGLFKRIF